MPKVPQSTVDHANNIKNIKSSFIDVFKKNILHMHYQMAITISTSLKKSGIVYEQN